MCRIGCRPQVRDAAAVVEVGQPWLEGDQVFVHVPDDDPVGGDSLLQEQLHALLTCRTSDVASTMVTHHTSSPIAANARGRSQAVTSESRSVVSFIAVMDHSSALIPAFRSPVCSRFQAARQPGEQNRACSRRGANEVPHR